jgi:hypothetical protein
VKRVDEGVLAWALFDSASAFLEPTYRATLCAKIGAGDRDNAIRDLLACFANTQVELRFELAAPIRRWIQGYAGSDSEPILRNVYDRIRVSVANTASSRRSEAEFGCSPERSSPNAASAQHASEPTGSRHIGA